MEESLKLLEPLYYMEASLTLLEPLYYMKEILRFLEGEKYLRESSVARNRKNLGGGRSDEAGDRGRDFAISGGGKVFKGEEGGQKSEKSGRGEIG